MLGGLVFANVTFVTSGRRTRRNRQHLLRQVTRSWALGLLIVLGILYSLKTSSEFSRGLILLWAALGLPFFLVALHLEQKIVDILANAGLAQRWVAIVGATSQAQQLAAHLGSDGMAEDLHLVGVFDERDQEQPAVDSAVPISGDLRDQKDICTRELLDAVILALPGDDIKRVRAVVDALRALPVDLLLGPDLVQLEFQPQAVSKLGPLSVANLSKLPMRDWWGVAKWLEDKVISLLALIALLPILFRQRRFGLNNQEFQIFKFRTMHQSLGDASGANATKSDDPRVTRVGRFLRRTSLDELPQLLNVLCGEMSIVGPRAHPVNMRLGDQLIHHRIGYYAARHRVKPGITGLAQVNGNRGEVLSLEKAEQRIQYDLHYIDSWSVWLDMEIILQTVLKLPFDRSAY